MNHKRKIIGIVLLSAGLATQAVGSPTIAPDAKQPKARLELRSSLYQAGEVKAKADIGRFRALCDSQGYPLVGNVANKGMRYDVASFCADVRTTLKKTKA
jgi:hypothetical protein